MINFRSKIFAAAFLLLILLPLRSVSQNKVRNVVVFFSLSANLPSYQNFLEGFNSTFNNGSSEPVNLIIEYLDIGRTTQEIYARHIVDLYNTKFNETGIDLLITFGPGIYPILEKYGLEALKTSPAINIELDRPGRGSYKASGNVNSIDLILKLRTSNTLRTAFNLFPAFHNVYVISGMSGTDEYFTSSIEKCKNEFEPFHNFTFVSGITIDSTIQFVRKIPANSIVIVTTYLLDKNNIPFSTPEVINIISRNCKAPVFPVTDSFTKKEGGIGGNILSFVYLGKETGRIGTAILQGKKAQDIIVNENSFYQNIYDWKQLKEWNLTRSEAIPGDSLFYNQDFSFFAAYKWYILGLMLFLISQTVLIFYLTRLNRRQKVITVQMLETENMHRELIREDRLAKMTELTASLSHELNQPLTAILYSAQAGKRFLQSGKLDSAQANEIFDNIIEDDKRAGGIISSVKSLMKLENREMSDVNLNALIRETIDIIHSDAVKHNIKVLLRLVDDPVRVFGDKIQLQQVLMNFIRNATTAMEGSNPEYREMEITLRLDNGYAVVSVRDYGPGIDEEVKEKLFKPFITTSKKGFGIGLALSRSIIEKHDGEISAENIAGGGAMFSFRLRTSDYGLRTDKTQNE